jgi:hypothetical protein
MAQFKNWTDKMLVDLQDTVQPIEEVEQDDPDMLIDFDMRLKALVAAAFKKKPTGNISADMNKFNKIHRDTAIKNVTQKINKYDNAKKSIDDKYKTLKDTFKTEVNIADESAGLDAILDKALCQKLAVPVVETAPSEKIIAELDEQQRIAEQRAREYMNRTKFIKSLIKKHDSTKKTKDPNYKDFEEICLDNEVMVENDFVNISITDKNIDECAIAKIEL